MCHVFLKMYLGTRAGYRRVFRGRRDALQLVSALAMMASRLGSSLQVATRKWV
jgi:hypothetical protein